MRLVHTFAMIGAPVLVLFAASLESRHHTNPPSPADHGVQENLHLPAKIDMVVRRSCFDCHSNETRWPWYSNVPGIGSLLEHDVTRGREAMNFSEWSTSVGRTPLQAGGMLLAACQAVRQHSMPKRNYLLLHSEAKLEPAEVDEFCGWAKSEAAELARANR
jgi:hypothetical protein